MDAALVEWFICTKISFTSIITNCDFNQWHLVASMLLLLPLTSWAKTNTLRKIRALTRMKPSHPRLCVANAFVLFCSSVRLWKLTNSGLVGLAFITHRSSFCTVTNCVTSVSVLFVWCCPLLHLPSSSLSHLLSYLSVAPHLLGSLLQFSSALSCLAHIEHAVRICQHNWFYFSDVMILLLRCLFTIVWTHQIISKL